MVTESPSRRLTTIQPSKGWPRIGLRELWAYRELVYFLIWRDVKIRYKQTLLGVVWAVLQPLLMAVVFTLIFANLAGVSSGNVPYAIFAYVALLAWNLFAKGLTDGSRSLVANEAMVTKVYFPRLILPIAAILAGLVDFAFGFVVLIGLLLYYGILPTLAVLALPFFIVIAVMASMGIAFWLSAIDARYRDVRYTLPFLAQVWFFATPVVYPLNVIPEAWRWIYSLNPMVGVVEGFRWTLLGASWSLDSSMVGLSVAVLVAIFLGGLVYFRKTERIFADTV